MKPEQKRWAEGGGWMPSENSEMADCEDNRPIGRSSHNGRNGLSAVS